MDIDNYKLPNLPRAGAICYAMTVDYPTQKDLLSLMRLLSAIESAMLMADKTIPSHLYEQIDDTIAKINTQLLEGD
jgi:hypothetical protein